MRISIWCWESCRQEYSLENPTTIAMHCFNIDHHEIFFWGKPFLSKGNLINLAFSAENYILGNVTIHSAQAQCVKTPQKHWNPNHLLSWSRFDALESLPRLSSIWWNSYVFVSNNLFLENLTTMALIFPTNQKDGLHILLMELFSSGIQTPESFREKKGDTTTALSPFLRMNVLLLHAWMKDTYKTDCAPYLSTYNQLCTIYNQIATMYMRLINFEAQITNS